jgi:hypothetical protein
VVDLREKNNMYSRVFRKHQAQFAVTVLAIFLMIGISGPAMPQDASIIVPAEDIWAEVKITGQPSGYYHEKIDRDKAGEISTTVEMILAINRVGSKVEIRTSSLSKESMGGLLLANKNETSSSKQSTLMEVTIGDGSLRIRRNLQMGRGSNCS